MSPIDQHGKGEEIDHHQATHKNCRVGGDIILRVLDALQCS